MHLNTLGQSLKAGRAGHFLPGFAVRKVATRQDAPSYAGQETAHDWLYCLCETEMPNLPMCMLLVVRRHDDHANHPDIMLPLQHLAEMLPSVWPAEASHVSLRATVERFQTLGTTDADDQLRHELHARKIGMPFQDNRAMVCVPLGAILADFSRFFSRAVAPSLSDSEVQDIFVKTHLYEQLRDLRTALRSYIHSDLQSRSNAHFRLYEMYQWFGEGSVPMNERADRLYELSERKRRQELGQVNRISLKKHCRRTGGGPLRTSSEVLSEAAAALAQLKSEGAWSFTTAPLPLQEREGPTSDAGATCPTPPTASLKTRPAECPLRLDRNHNYLTHARCGRQRR